jgi:hypothetical protein
MQTARDRLQPRATKHTYGAVGFSQGPPLRGRHSGGVAAMVTIKKAPGGAQFEISIDGKPCSYRDRKDIAIAAAEFLKRKFPNSDVVVKHLPSGEVTVAAYKPHDDTH